MQETSIYQIVRDAESNLLFGNVHQSKYVDFSMYETLSTIDAYSNSKHISGLKDSLRRDKPFFNIVTAATNIWYRATDLDRKDIKFLPENTNQVALAFLASIMLQRWMDKNNFGMFLNQWGRTLAKYGSAVVKFVEKGDDLIPSVISWNRFIADSIDFNAIPRVEKFYKTPAQLKNMATQGHPDYAGYEINNVNQLIDAYRTTRKDFDGQSKDNSQNFIEIYEVHGELSVADYKKGKGAKPLDGDENNFKQQIHVISSVQVNKNEYSDFTLFCGYEKEDPYMITHLIEEDGRTLSIGAVEYLFDAQWMQNHTLYQWKNQLDLASQLIFQTADQNYIGRNVLSNIQTGDIFVHAPNMPLTLVNNQGHDSASMQAFSSMWRSMSQELTNTPDLTRGITQAQPVTYGLGQIMNANSNSLFEIMVENKGIYLEQMAKKFIIPHLKKQLDTDEEVMAALDDAGIAEIDAMYIPNAATRIVNERYINKVLDTPAGILPMVNGQEMSQDTLMSDIETEKSNIKNEFDKLGNRRSFKPTVIKNGKSVPVKWKEVFSDFNWDNVKVQVTNENKDKQAVLSTLSSTFETIAKNPGILNDPNAKMLFSKILNETAVVSPMELTKSPLSPSMPGGATPGVGGGELQDLIKKQ